MTTTDALEALYLHDERIKRVRAPLLMTLALGLLGLIGLVRSLPALGIVGWMGGCLIGLYAVSRAASGMRSGPLLKYPMMFCTFMPGLSVIPAVYYLVVTGQRRGEVTARIQQAEAAEQRRSRQAPAAAGPAAPADAGPQNPTEGALQALPIVRLVAALGSADGAPLEMRLPSELAGQYPDAKMPPMRSTAGVFGVGYRWDAGDTWRSVGMDEAEAAGMSLNQLHKRSLANLMALVKGQPGLRIHASQPYAGLLLDGENESSLVLLDGVWEAFLKQQTPHGAVVAIPFRDVLMFCDASSAAGIAAMRAKLREMAEKPRFISSELLLRRDGRWSILPA